MARELVTNAQRAAYESDGAVCLRGVVDDRWIAVLRAGFEHNLTNPSDWASLFYGDAMSFVGLRDAETRGAYSGRDDLAAAPQFMNDVDNWRGVPEFEDFLFNSSVAELAARVMGSAKANLLLQDVMMKAPGNDLPTPWHQDAPSQPLSGDQTCAVWIPLDPVARANTIEYVRGSHRWGEAYLQLGVDDPVAHYGPGVAAFKQTPDVEASRDDYEIVGWDVEPGDCIVHHGYVLHGAPGNAGATTRRTFVARWTGDDIRYFGAKQRQLRPQYPDCRLADGDPMDSATFPVVWRA